MPLLIWFGRGLIAAVGLAWIAAQFHAAQIAPVGILSLATGIALGVVLCWLVTTRLMKNHARLWMGALVLATVAVFAEHAWLYRDFRREWREARAKDPRVALFRPSEPWSPSEYFGRELTSANIALWAADAALVMAGAVGTFLVAERKRRRNDSTTAANARTTKS